MSITKAQQRANTKYVKKSYDTLISRVKKGEKTTIQTHATTQSESLNAFINRAIAETMERDNAKKAED